MSACIIIKVQSDPVVINQLNIIMRDHTTALRRPLPLTSPDLDQICPSCLQLVAAQLSLLDCCQLEWLLQFLLSPTRPSLALRLLSVCLAVPVDNTNYKRNPSYHGEVPPLQPPVTD